MSFNSKIKTIEWVDNVSRMIDQTILPKEFKLVDIKTCEEMYDAIKTMIVRGAPAIGIAGAHGVALAAIEAKKSVQNRKDFDKILKEKGEYLKSSRPTAVNLMWAVDKQLELLSEDCSIDEITQKLIDNAIVMENEDIEINKRMGDFGAEIVPKGATILTHCNAGALATVGYGTALGVVRSAYAHGRNVFIFYEQKND